MLARENSGRSVRPSAIFFHKAVLGGNMNSSRMAAALPCTVNTKFSPFSCNVFSIVWIDEVFIKTAINITLNSASDS